ncbi:MAG: hypothetical protein AB7Q17_00895 [Phycisphaerae bacterium]
MHRRVALLVAAALVPAAYSAVVYSNTQARTGVVHDLVPAGAASGPERGNSITLAGTQRVVTSIDVILRIGDSGVGLFDMQVRLYANDGPNGDPGTLLWESALRRTIIDSGVDLPYRLTVPRVVVPSSITWTVEITNRTMSQAMLGPSTYAPVTVGSAAPGYWEHSGGMWMHALSGEPAWGAAVNADPLRGDLNCDGRVDNFDLSPFALALVDPAAYAAAYPNCTSAHADINNDGQANNFDIDGFVACIVGGGCP